MFFNDTEAKEAMSKGSRTMARSHLSIVVDLENRKGRYKQQFLTLETALLNLEEAKTQADVLRAFTIANDALTEARSMLRPEEIQMQLDLRLVFVVGDLAEPRLCGHGIHHPRHVQIERLPENDKVLPPRIGVLLQVHPVVLSVSLEP